MPPRKQLAGSKRGRGAAKVSGASSKKKTKKEQKEEAEEPILTEIEKKEHKDRKELAEMAQKRQQQDSSRLYKNLAAGLFSKHLYPALASAIACDPSATWLDPNLTYGHAPELEAALDELCAKVFPGKRRVTEVRGGKATLTVKGVTLNDVAACADSV